CVTGFAAASQLLDAGFFLRDQVAPHRRRAFGVAQRVGELVAVGGIEAEIDEIARAVDRIVRRLDDRIGAAEQARRFFEAALVADDEAEIQERRRDTDGFRTEGALLNVERLAIGLFRGGIIHPAAIETRLLDQIAIAVEGSAAGNLELIAERSLETASRAVSAAECEPGCRAVAGKRRH